MGQSSTNSTQIECPMISMVVIGRNEGDLLVRCFESIRAVDYPADRMELIYVDSNSTDESCEVARRANAVVIKIEEGPMSAARARNRVGPGRRVTWFTFLMATRSWIAIGCTRRLLVCRTQVSAVSSAGARNCGRLRRYTCAYAISIGIFPTDPGAPVGELHYFVVNSSDY
ncbi:MAG: glycosyltransferase family 2 protein [Planctomycetes bacterium]|nr:glycosyltransferase family 2 protein [Planctomycetota bacterium]